MMIFLNEIDKQQTKQLFDEKGYTEPYDLFDKNIVKKITKDLLHQRSLWTKFAAKFLNKKYKSAYLNRHLDRQEIRAIAQDKNMVLCLTFEGFGEL